MRLSDRYEVPQELIDNPPSPAFRQFLLHWFGSNSVHTPERLRSIDELSPEEIPIAQATGTRQSKDQTQSPHPT